MTAVVPVHEPVTVEVGMILPNGFLTTKPVKLIWWGGAVQTLGEDLKPLPEGTRVVESRALREARARVPRPSQRP